MKKKIIYILIIVFLLLSAGNLSLALEVEYPDMPEIDFVGTSLPLYMAWWFYFLIRIGFFVVFAVVIYSGFLYVTSAGRSQRVSEAKSRLISALIGLIILITSYLIIVTLNPEILEMRDLEVFRFPGLYIEKSPDVRQALGMMGIFDNQADGSKWERIVYDCEGDKYPTLVASFYEEPNFRNIIREKDLKCGDVHQLSPEERSFNFVRKKDGVSLYQAEGCEVTTNRPLKHITENIYDLTDFRNKISSASIDYVETAYIGVLFEETNLQGSCYYIHPNIDCDELNREGFPPFNNKASSAAVYKYDFDVRGEGVTFYRNSFHQKEGGYLTIKPEEFEGIYAGILGNLKFTGSLDNTSEEDCTVPVQERDCVNWDYKGQCIERECPNLTGKNISSMSIDGDYFVLFTSSDPMRGAWGACQGFPTPNDKKREGPNQIKWEYIHYPGRFPTYVYIFPVK